MSESNESEEDKAYFKHLREVLRLNSHPEKRKLKDVMDQLLR
jgi:hypothetical protein